MTKGQVTEHIKKMIEDKNCMINSAPKDDSRIEYWKGARDYLQFILDMLDKYLD